MVKFTPSWGSCSIPSSPKRKTPFPWQGARLPGLHMTHMWCASLLQATGMQQEEADIQRQHFSFFSRLLPVKTSCCLYKCLQSFNPSLKPPLAVMLTKTNPQHSQCEGSVNQDKRLSSHCDSTRHAVLPTASLRALTWVPEVRFSEEYSEKRPLSLHQQRV